MTSRRLPRDWSDGSFDRRIAALLLRLPPRIQVLLGAEWARSVLPLFEAAYPTDRRPRTAVEKAEAWVYTSADPGGTIWSIGAAEDAACAVGGVAWAVVTAAWAVARDAEAASCFWGAAVARAVADATRATEAKAEAGKWRWLEATYRHALGPRGLRFDPAWQTPTAVALARGIVGERAFDRMPILADALEEAGLSHAGLLDHLRTDRGEWTAADWALTRLLGIDQPHTAV